MTQTAGAQSNRLADLDRALECMRASIDRQEEQIEAQERAIDAAKEQADLISQVTELHKRVRRHGWLTPEEWAAWKAAR